MIDKSKYQRETIWLGNQLVHYCPLRGRTRSLSDCSPVTSFFLSLVLLLGAKPWDVSCDKYEECFVRSDINQQWQEVSVQFEIFCQQYFTEGEGWRLKRPGWGGVAQTPYVSPCEEMDMVTRAIINQLKDFQPLVPSQKLPFTWLAM